MTAVASLSLAGCTATDIEYGASKKITFSPSVCDTQNGTRGDLINSGDNFFPTKSDHFFVASYGIEALVKGANIPAYTKVKHTSGSTWSTVDNSGKTLEYCWVIGTTQRFFAYANLPTVAGSASVACTGDSKQTLTYDASKVTAAADQKDILLGFYQGTATTSTTAQIPFYHPLTSLKFTFSNESLSYYTLKKLTVSGLAKSGSMDMNEYGLFQDWTISSFDMSIERTSGFDGWYILIPQGLSDHPVTVTAVLNNGGENVTANTTINTGAWVNGEMNVYQLKYSDYKEMDGLVVELLDWKAVMNNDSTYFSIDFNK